MIDAPTAVEAKFLGEANSRRDLVPRLPLLRDVETEPHIVLLS